MRAGGLALVGIMIAGQAAAQAARRPHRSGLWAESISGVAFARIATAESEEITVAGGGAFSFRIGGTLSDKVLLGIESFGFLDEAFSFASEDSAAVAETGSVAIVVVWFPGRRGLFLTGGVGLAEGRFTVTPDSGPPVIARGTGIGLSFGLGWDLPISRKLALTAGAGAVITGIGDVVLPAGRVDDVIASMYHIGFGLTVR